MLTYLLLSNGIQENGDRSCPVQRCFEEFTSHQLDLRRPAVHANLALRRVVWTGWQAHVGLLTLLVSFTLFAGQQNGQGVAGAGCHFIGVATAEE